MKKVLCIILVICLAVAFVAGCNSGQSDTSPANNTAPDGNTSTGGGSTAPSGNTSTGGASTPAGNNTANDPSTPPVDNTVYHFNVSLHAPEFSCTEVTAGLDRIQEISNGRIEMTYYYSWSLSSVPTIVDDMNVGVVDIGVIPVNEHLNLFPYTNLVTYTPFLGLPDMRETARIYDEMLVENSVFVEEYAKNGLVYWTNIPNPNYDIFLGTDHEIRVPSDLNGIKLITSSSMMQRFITQNGGAPVMTPVTEYATSLSTNVVDGAINHANVMRGFGVIDFIKGVTLFGDQGTAKALMILAFSEQAWNKLPADLQQIFIDEAENIRENQGEWDFNSMNGNIGAIRGAGGNVIELSDAEIQVWRDAFSTLLDEYIDDLTRGGATEARAMYNAVQAKIAGR